VAIAHYLAQFRGIRCVPGQVIIFNSAQQVLQILALLLLNPGDRVWIEDPCYLGARAALELAHASITPVPVDNDGMRVEIGVRRSPRARMAYVTPSHRYPTGVALSLDRRIALIDWTARNDAWIVERLRRRIPLRGPAMDRALFTRFTGAGPVRRHN
jgi:GntR family transcriptional regulator/MocR family aminotransferase